LLVIDLDELLISENLRGCVTSFKKNIVISIKRNVLASTIKTILLVKGKG
jgi:Arc/MetJ family transcription regulator